MTMLVPAASSRFVVWTQSEAMQVQGDTGATLIRRLTGLATEIGAAMSFSLHVPC